MNSVAIVIDPSRDGWEVWTHIEIEGTPYAVTFADPARPPYAQPVLTRKEAIANALMKLGDHINECEALRRRCFDSCWRD